MGNPFDQFDTQASEGSNPFDQFDAPKKQDNALVRGLTQANSARKTFGALTTGDYESAAKLAAERDAYQRANPGTPEGNELMAAWEKGDGVIGGIKGVAGEFAKDWREAPTGIAALQATGKNLSAMGGGIVEQIPNMVMPMTGMLAGGAAGSLAGPVGTVGGAFVGAATGNTAAESAEQVDRAIRGAGINPQDTNAVRSFLEQDAGGVLGKSAIKGGIIGAVDTATMGIGGKMLRAPVNAATDRAIASLGINAADKAAVSAAREQIGARVLADPIYQASQKGVQALARNATVGALEPVGEFAGEYLGQGAATGDWDTKGAMLEALSSLGQSGITYAGQKIYQSATSPLRGIKADQTAPQDAPTIPPDVSLTSDPVPVQQRIDAMLGLDTNRMDDKNRKQYESDLVAAFNEPIGIRLDANQNEVPYTMGEYLDSQIKIADNGRAKPMRSSANQQATTRLDQLAEEEAQQHAAITQDLVRSAAQGGVLSKAALTGIQTGATQMPVHPERAAIEQQMLLDEAAQAELAPVERLMRKLPEARVQSIAQNPNANESYRKAAIADLQRRMTTQAQPTTTAPLQHTVTKLHIPDNKNSFNQTSIESRKNSVLTSLEPQSVRKHNALSAQGNANGESINNANDPFVMDAPSTVIREGDISGNEISPAKSNKHGSIPSRNESLGEEKVQSINQGQVREKTNDAQTWIEQGAAPQARIKRLQAQLENTEPFTEQSSALTDALQSAVTQDAQSALNAGEMPVYKVTDHVSVAIHPSAQNSGMVQVTRYTKDGVIGDSQYNNVDDAVRQEGLTHKPRIASNDAVAVIEKSIQAESEYQQRKSAAPVPNADAGIGVNTKKPKQPTRQERDDLVGAILKATNQEGISEETAIDAIGDTANNSKLIGLFKKGGTIDFDDLADKLNEDGYNIEDGNALKEMLRSMNGGDKVVSPERMERDATDNEEAKRKDYYLKRAEELGLKKIGGKRKLEQVIADVDAKEAEIAAKEQEIAELEAREERAAIQASVIADNLYQEGSELTEADLMQWLGDQIEYSQDEINEADSRQSEIESRRAEANAGYDSEEQAQGRSPEGAGTGSPEVGTRPTEGFSLAGQTNAEAAEAERKRIAAEAEESRLAAQDAADKKAAEKKSLEDAIRERAANPDNFQFGEDAKAAAKPMGGLFDQPAPAPVDRKVTTEDARGQQDVFAQANPVAQPAPKEAAQPEKPQEQPVTPAVQKEESPKIEAWHTAIPTEGLPLTDAQKANKPRAYETVTGIVATDAWDAITQTQRTGMIGLYAYVLPATNGRNGIARLFPDDQTPPAPWKLADQQVIRQGSMTREQGIQRLRDVLVREPIIGDEKAESHKKSPAAVDAKKEAGTDDGIRYSKVSDAPAGEELIAIHNLSAENVLHAAAIGGIPVPSIGITKLSSPFTAFGEITLIADKGMIDPENSVPVFDRDAYTARFPEFNYKKVTAKKADAFYERMNVARELGDDGQSFISQLWDAVKNARVQSPKKVADLFRTYLAPRMLYAKEVLGKEIKAPMIPIKASVFFGHEKSWRDFVKNNAELKRTDEDAYNAAAAKAIKIAANEFIDRASADNEIRSQIRSAYMAEVDRYAKDSVNWNYLDRAIKSAQDFGKKRVDAVALSNRVAKIVPQDDPGYLKWVSNEISDLFVAPTITLRGKEVEASLDNIVEAMTIGKTNGAEKTMTFGVGKTSALLGKRFKSIKEIQDHRNQVVSSSRESDMKKDSEKLLEEYRLKAVEHFTHTDWKGHIDTFAGFDAAMEALAKAGKGALTDGNIASAMRSVGFKNVPSDVINLARQGIVSIREAATDYFEAKPQRAVKLNEFNGAIVPNGTAQEVIDALKSNGITDIRTYKRGDEEGRKKSVALLAKKIHAQNNNTLFSNSAEGATQSAPITRTEAETRIKSILGDKLGKVLIDSGIVTFTNKGNEYQGATYKDGSIALNLDALNADNFAGVFAHEGFHSTIRDLVGEQTYTQMMKQLDTMLAMGNGAQWVKDANAAIPSNTKAEHRTEEIAAYSIEQYVNGAKQPSAVKRWVESLLSALRTAIIRRLPMSKLKAWAINNLQPQDLANLAIAGLKAKARGQLQAQGREAMALSRNENGANVSRMADKDTVAGTQAPTSVSDGSTGSAKAPHIAAAEQILSLMDDPVYTYGLRVLPSDFTDPVKPRETIPSSFVWQDGDITDEEINGVSTAGIRRSDLESVLAAMKNLGVTGKNGPNGYYFGSRVVLVRGDSNGSGQDVGETIIRDPEVLGEWKKPNNGLSEVMPNEPSASAGSDVQFSKINQTDTPAFKSVDDLNAAMLENEGIENAFSPSSLGDKSLIKAFKETFGVDVVPVKANTEQGKQFLGMNYGGKLYVNAENEHAGFVQIAGHELLHQIANDSPGIYKWFSGIATDYLRSGSAEHYGERLKAQGANLDNEATHQEILADFVGDALADKNFLQALADNNQSKFKMFVSSVIKWLGNIANKLSGKGFESSQYFNDVNGLRGYLVGVLDAYSKTKSIPDSGAIRYSRAQIVGDSGRQYDQTQRQFFKNVGRDIEKKNLVERTTEYLKNDFWKKMAVGIVDQFRGLRDLGDNGQAYMLARLSKGTAGAFDALLHHGKLSIRDGVYDADTSGGFIDRLGAPLHGELDDFLWYVAANRAERLSRVDRENLFTPADIAAGKSLAQGQTDFDYTIQTGPQRGTTTRNRTLIYADANRVFNEFQKNALDMAEQSGLIDGASRKLWESEFYVPFYRVSEEDGEFIGAKMGNALVRQQAFKKLKGGTDKLNSDLLSNTLLNFSHLIEASAKNRAAKASLAAAEKIGAADRVAPDMASYAASNGAMLPPGTKGTVWFQENGKKVEYKVTDPFVMTAITSLEYAGMRNGVMDVMTKFKHWLTIGVTASPAFKVRNLIRDSIQSIGASDLSYNPIKNIAEGYKQTKRDSQEYVSALASGGLIRFGTMLEGSESSRVRQLVKSGVKDSTILNSENKWRAFYDQYLDPVVSAYNELGNRSEEINRAALYNQLIKQGKSHAEAALLARDLMDFSMQGSFNTIRFLTQVVPFMNARLQGMYKLGRAAKDNPRKLAVVTGAVALASIALMLAYGDDDDWKRREDWDRDGFWWFKLGGIEFRIPKPFEVGAIGSLAERSLELMIDDEMTGERFRRVVNSLVMNNLSMNPIPQAFKPILDLYSNKDSFTGRPIESMGMQRLDPTERFNSNTSMIARGMSNASFGALSPVQIDHLARAYFGWLGSFAIGGADMAFRGMSDQPTKPALDYFKFGTQGILKEAGTGSSRYVTQVYEQAKELEQAHATYRQMIKDGRIDEAKEYATDNQDKMIRYRQVEAVKKVESNLNERIRKIERSDMDSGEKKDAIALINKQKEQVAKRIAAGAG